MNRAEGAGQPATFELAGGYALNRANPKQFGIHTALYRNVDLLFEPSWESRWNRLATKSGAFWITKEGQRIGGVCLGPNAISNLFLEPPWIDTYPVLKSVKPLLLEWSDPSKDILATEVLPHERNVYQRLGFWFRSAARSMARPTEPLEVSWPDDVRVSAPEEAHLQEMAQLIFEVIYEPLIGLVSERSSLESQVRQLQRGFKLFGASDILRQASSVVFRESGEIIGVCLIGLAQEWPSVYDVAVRPRFQGRGLGTSMLQHALTSLYPHYPLLRLLVSTRNRAQSLYHNLGFLPGQEYATLRIPAGTW
jgi:ribosomal protein S18 acetylase RimI-like enzyme